MIVNSQRFGDIEVQPSQIFDMVRPPIGFSDTQFALVSRPDTEPMQWLQSMSSPDVCLPLTDPLAVRRVYDIEIPTQDCEELDLKRPQDALILTVVVLASDPRSIRTNLRAPIVFNIVNGRAAQVVLSDTNLPIQYFILGTDSEQSNKEVADVGVNSQEG